MGRRNGRGECTGSEPGISEGFMRNYSLGVQLHWFLVMVGRGTRQFEGLVIVVVSVGSESRERSKPREERETYSSNTRARFFIPCRLRCADVEFPPKSDILFPGRRISQAH